jgi:peroxiredoxin
MCSDMRTPVLFLLLFPLFSISQSVPNGTQPTAKKSFIIKCSIDGLQKGTSVRLVNPNTGAEIATSTVQETKTQVKKNGKIVTVTKTGFTLNGTLVEPDLNQIIIGNFKPYNLYLENGTITLSGPATDMSKWVVKGSSSHNDFSHFEKTFTPLAQQLNTLAGMINSLGTGQSRDSLMGVYSSVQQSIQSEIDKFVTTRPKSYVSPFVMLVLMSFNDDPVLAETRFNKLDASVKGSYLGNYLARQIAESKIGAIGTQALEFTQPDTSGTPVSLSSFRGKYVLIDFWASWCRPCREENPTVVYNYNKFRSKNFTVLGISLDREGQRDKWIEAIHVDSLTWTHVSDLQFWNNAVAQLYHVKGIPQNFLVDPNGKIIGKNLRGPELEAKLCEILGCN